MVLPPRCWEQLCGEKWIPTELHDSEIILLDIDFSISVNILYLLIFCSSSSSKCALCNLGILFVLLLTLHYSLNNYDHQIPLYLARPIISYASFCGDFVNV